MWNAYTNERTDGPKELNKTKQKTPTSAFKTLYSFPSDFWHCIGYFVFISWFASTRKTCENSIKAKNSFETAVWPQITPSSLSTRVNNNSCKQILCWKLKTCEKRVQYRTLAIITHNRTAYRITAKMRIN